MSGNMRIKGSTTGNYYKIVNGEKQYFNKDGKKITQEVFCQEENVELKGDKFYFNKKSEEKATDIQKQSAKKIVDDILAAKGTFNDDEDAMKSALKRINNPEELKEVERLLKASGKYKSDELHSSLEKFIAEELGDEYSEEFINGLIKNGALKGEDANKAQARMAARVITKAGDGAGTDYDELVRGMSLIKAPKETGNIGQDKANAKAVLVEVEKIIKQHSNESLKEYLQGEVWGSEIKDMYATLAKNNAIHDDEKTDAVAEQFKQAVEGAGTNE